MKYKKLESKKLPAPKKRSIEAYAMILRAGAGAGHHGDKKKYTRKSKHKERYNPALAEGKITERIKAAYSAQVRPALEGLLKALDDAGFKSLRPAYTNFSSNVTALNRIMALSSVPFYAEEVRIHDPATLVIAETLGFKPGGPWAAVMEDEAASKIAAPFIAVLARDLETQRAPALAQIAEMKGGMSAGDDEEEMDEEFENFLSGKGGSASEEEEVEVEEKRESKPRSKPAETAGFAISDEMKARLDALRKAAPAEVEEDEEEEETSRRTGSGLTKVKKVVEKLVIPESRSELETAPFLQFTAKSRSSVRPPADMLAQVKDDILLYALQDHTTQTYLKGSLTQTFVGSLGRSSVKVAASYADAWRREGKKSRQTARIFVAVEGDGELILRSPALTAAAASKSATPVTIDDIKKQLKIEVLSNPRYRRNGLFGVVGGFAVGVAAERFGRITDRTRALVGQMQAKRKAAPARAAQKVEEDRTTDAAWQREGGGHWRKIDGKQYVVAKSSYGSEYMVDFEPQKRGGARIGEFKSLAEGKKAAERHAKTVSNPRSRGDAKYADVKAKYGARGFAFPEKAPYVGSFPVYPIGRARYALAIVAAPTYDHKQSEREKVIAAVKAAYPRDAKIKAEIATVRERVASRMRAVANPRRRRNGPTMDMPYYPRTEKESIYLVLSDKELRESLKDAQSALKKAVENAKKGKGFPSAPKWYADDVQTILAELNRRGIR